MKRLRKHIAGERAWLSQLAHASRELLAGGRGALAVLLEQGARWAVEHVGAAMSRLRRAHKPTPSRAWLRGLLQVVLLASLLSITYQVINQQTIFPQPPIFASAPQQRLLVVHDSTDKFGEMAYTNATQALDYARLQYDDVDLAGDPWPALNQYSALVFVAEVLDKIDESQVQRITNYVAEGGGLAVAYRGWNPELAPLFGVELDTDYPDVVEDVGGLQFHTDFIPGVQGLKLSEKAVHDLSFYDVRLRPGVQTIATSGNGSPIVWEHRYGQGRVIFWNTSFLVVKEARGFIVQSVLHVQGLGVLPIANFATIQIDDFPAAVSTEKIEPVKSEYDMTLMEFYDQVWFPDMMDIARRYGLVYTFIIPFNYNDLIEPPFGFREWEHARIDVDRQSIPYAVYASHLAAREHELGLHGYNHISLTLENWPSEDNMVAALQMASQRWDEDNLGPQPITYVPPNNIYDAAGARALTEGFPSLKVLAGIYTNRFEEGGNREFGPEPWNPQLFDIPRVTFGYNMTQRYRFLVLSEIGMMGIWTHFIHPDDVVHTPENYPQAHYHRNPKYWPWRGDHTGEKNGFYYRFLRWLDFLKTHYPWLRYTRTDESYYILRRHLENEVQVDLKPHEVVVHSSTPTYFQVRINDGRRVDLNALQGAQFVDLHQGEGYTLYTLRGLKTEVHLKLLIPETPEESVPARATVPAEPEPDQMTEEDETELGNLQDEGLWEKAGVPTPPPESQPAPTATPALDVLPMSTPTLRSRP